MKQIRVQSYTPTSLASCTFNIAQSGEIHPCDIINLEDYEKMIPANTDDTAK